MKVKIVQLSSGSDKSRNTEKSIRLASSGQPSDLIIFPEYQMLIPDFAQPGKTRKLAETEDGEFVRAMCHLSVETNSTVLCNGSIVDPKGLVRNRSLFISDGKIAFRYDKTHLYDALKSKESAVYKYGVYPYKGFKVAEFTVGPLICYDVRFPEAARTLRLNGSRLITYQSGWFAGKGKKEQWLTLLGSRAIENGCYVAGVAQTGKSFTGYSVVFDPYGNTVGKMGKEEGIIDVEITPSLIESYDRDYPLVDQRRTDLYSAL